MKNKKKLWMISFICAGAGVILLLLGLMLGGLPGYYIDARGVHPAGESQYGNTVKGKKELKAFDDISVAVEDADIEIIPSDQYAVEFCIQGGGREPVLKVEDGRLTFQEKRPVRIANFYIGGWNFGIGDKVSYYVKVYMPLYKEYSEIQLKSDYGDITVPELNADRVQIDCEDGDVTVAKIKADTLQIDNEYGNVMIEEFVGKQFVAQQEDGDLAITALAADQVSLNNEYGSIMIQKGRGKSLTADMEDGDFAAELLDYEKTDIQNEYGNVGIELPVVPSEYTLDLDTEYGRIAVDGYRIADGDKEVHYKMDGTSGKQLKIACEDGDIFITQNK